jgi:uncharacterized PurR-regulated membrane protein YhhQ (DUF165 family)
MLARLLTPRFAAAVLAMVVVVTASNILVQFPLRVSLGPVDLADILTWGAFTYPLAFLVSDLTNRHFGANTARIVVVIGFAVAVVISAYLSAPRIALASGMAFIVGQFLDISVFQRLRNWLWYLPPLVGSLLGSAIDTLVFFSLAFAPAFMFVDMVFGMPDGSLPFPAPLLGVGPEVPLWLALAAGDFCVKFLAAGVLLVPYRLLMGARARRMAVA